MKILVAYFCYKGVVEQSCFSMVEFVRRAAKENVEFACAAANNDALISRSRSRVLSRFFLGKVADVIVMLDHDIAFAFEDIMGACERAVAINGVVGVPYSWRSMNTKGWGGRTLDGELPESGKDVVIDVKYLGGGFIAIPMTVVAGMLSKLTGHEDPNLRLTQCDESDGSEFPYLYDFFRPFPLMKPTGKVEYLSEDWAFCERAAASGYKVCAWLKPQLRHYGLVPFAL